MTAAPPPWPPAPHHGSSLGHLPKANTVDMPLARPQRRWGLILGALLAAMLLVCSFSALGVGLLIHATGPDSDSRGAVAQAARGWAAQLPGVRLNLWLTDSDGQQTTGSIVVTADGDAAGTLTHPGGGTADLRSHDGVSTLDVDTAWRSRAAEDPDVPTTAPDIPPIDVAAAFTPRRLAALIATAVTGALGVEQLGDVNGTDLVSYSDGSWTFYLTAAAPHALVFLEGPVAPGYPVAPATTTGNATAVALPLFDTTTSVRPADNSYLNPYLAAAVAPATPEQTAAVSAASSAPPSTSASPKGRRPARAAAFSVRVEPVPPVCGTATCAARVSARNVGGSPARVSLFVSVIPGLPPTRFDAGTIAPGEATQDFLARYPNPVYASRGQARTTLLGWTWSPDLDGPDPALKQRLALLRLNPDGDKVLSRLRGPDRHTALRTLDLATRHLTAEDTKALDAARLAVRRAVDRGLLPEIGTLVAHADRLGNPADLAANLAVTDDNTRAAGEQPPAGIGHRRELEQVAHILRTRPTATVYYDGYVTDPAAGRRYGADLFIHDGAQRIAVQMKTVSSPKRLKDSITGAVKQLNGDTGPGSTTARGADANGVVEQAPPGYQRHVLIHLEPGTGILFAADRATLHRALADYDLVRHLCHEGQLRAEQLTIVNGAGSFTWTPDQFAALARSESHCP